MKSIKLHVVALGLSIAMVSAASMAKEVHIIAKPKADSRAHSQDAFRASKKPSKVSSLDRITVNESEARSVIDAMLASGDYEYVELDFEMRSVKPVKKQALNPYLMQAQSSSEGYNDTFYDSQYLFQNNEDHGAGLGVFEAHSIVPLRPLRVGVIDGGFMFGITDTDMSEGQSFMHENEVIYDTHLTDKECENGHGSGVASVIGASTNNNLGIAGIADVDMVMAQALECGTGRMSAAAYAIQWLAGVDLAEEQVVEGIPVIDEPVDVINMSLGFPLDFCPSLLQESINIAHEKNIIVIAAAGNDGQNVNDDALGNCENVITVAALGYDSSAPENGSRDLAVEFSNYGEGVEISTQGEWIVGASTNDTEFAAWDGTSFSAPIVAGATALIKQALPDATLDEVLGIMSLTSTPFALDSMCAELGCGAGALNVIGAVSLAKTISDTGYYASLKPVLASGVFCDDEVYTTNNGALARLCESYVFSPSFEVDERVSFTLYELSSAMPASVSELPMDAVELASNIKVGDVLGFITPNTQYAFVKCVDGECEAQAFALNVDNSEQIEACNSL